MGSRTLPAQPLSPTVADNASHFTCRPLLWPLGWSCWLLPPPPPWPPWPLSPPSARGCRSAGDVEHHKLHASASEGSACPAPTFAHAR